MSGVSDESEAGARPRYWSAELQELRRVAEEAARAAGRAAMPFYGRVTVEEKAGPRDLVSAADRAAEAAAVALIRERRPQDAVWGEEGGFAAGSDERSAGRLLWGVDGVDGTTNFLATVPHWCASVGLEDDEGSLIGAVYDPVAGELYSAARGQGMTLDGREPKRRPVAERLEQAIVAYGISYSWHEGKGRIECLDRLLPRVAHGRQMGSMALDVGWLAAGRFDLYYYEAGMHPHDIAQRVIAQEAGYEVLLLDDSPVGPKAMFAAPPHLVDEALRVLGRR